MGVGGPMGPHNDYLGGGPFGPEVATGERLRRLMLASEPWASMDMNFTVSAEHLNRLEGTTDATVEPWRLETVGRKASLAEPTLLDLRASWLNLNFNVALADALLVYGYALIGVVVRQRALLHLNSRRLGPKTVGALGGPGGGGANRDICGQTVYGGTLKRPESLETRSARLAAAAAPTELGAQSELRSQHPQQQGVCCSGEESEASHALAAAAAAAEVPGYYAVLRPDGTVVGSSGFDLFAPLEDALSLELLGDHLLQRSSVHMSPCAEFAGDQLKEAQQQQQQHATPTPPVVADEATDKETGRPAALTHPQQQQQHPSHTSAAASQPDGSSPAAETTNRDQASSNPMLYNLLGQPIAIMTGKD